jgi:hypothetical protein
MIYNYVPRFLSSKDRAIISKGTRLELRLLFGHRIILEYKLP